MAANQDHQETLAILVIDDEEVVRLLFQSLLEEEGYKVLLADNGRSGVQMLDQHRPPLALVDKNLPDISGLELIAEQKKLHPNTEFIMITGYASLDSAVKAMEMGAFSYLTKPFGDLEVVMDRIRAALEVNTLRFETSLLRERLEGLTVETAATLQTPGAESVDPVRVQVEHTIRFLETFVHKRDQAPTASLWARTVDMIEEELKGLNRLIQQLRERR